MPSGSAMTEPKRSFEIPGRFVNHLRLFTDLDIRMYLTVLSLLRPETSGSIDMDTLAAKLTVTRLQILRSLLRLMAFGVVSVKSLDKENRIKTLELLPDHVMLPHSHSGHSQQPERIAEALNDQSNVELYQLIVRTVPSLTIQRAMDETLAVPAERIRKSRAALFIHLIRKYAKPQTENLSD
jgi:hypothetical protein